MTLYSDLDARSRSVLAAKYVFGSSVPRGASPAEAVRQGLDCAQFVAWAFGPWLQVPDYTGAIYTWAQKAGRLIPLSQRKPGDLVMWQPGFGGDKTGHVGIVLADINMVRQARSSHTNPNCGDFAYSKDTWQTAVRMDVVVALPAPTPPIPSSPPSEAHMSLTAIGAACQRQADTNRMQHYRAVQNSDGTVTVLGMNGAPISHPTGAPAFGNAVYTIDHQPTEFLGIEPAIDHGGCVAFFGQGLSIDIVA